MTLGLGGNKTFCRSRMNDTVLDEWASLLFKKFIKSKALFHNFSGLLYVNMRLSEATLQLSAARPLDYKKKSQSQLFWSI